MGLRTPPFGRDMLPPKLTKELSGPVGQTAVVGGAASRDLSVVAAQGRCRPVLGVFQEPIYMQQQKQQQQHEQKINSGAAEASAWEMAIRIDTRV